jgi:hypothetical protein
MQAIRAWAPLLVLVALAGCAEDVARCSIEADLVVDEVRDGSILVDGRSLILYTDQATILRADGCTPMQASDIKVGDRVGHDAQQIAESYPAQAWPKTIVVA